MFDGRLFHSGIILGKKSNDRYLFLMSSVEIWSGDLLLRMGKNWLVANYQGFAGSGELFCTIGYS